VDFILLKEPNLENYGIKSLAIELKKPEDKLFTKKGEISNQLKIGIDQIASIFNFINSNPKEAKKLLEINNHSDLIGIVIIGRKKDLTTGDLKRLNEINRTNKEMKILLFDDLLTNIKLVSKTLAKRIVQPVVVVGQKWDSTEDFTGKSSETIQEALNYLSRRIKEGN